MHVSADLLSYLRTIQNDRAMVQVFTANNPEFMDIVSGMVKAGQRKPIRPLPGTQALTAVEVAILDNWQHGKPVKSKPVRYGFGLNASTDAAPDVNQWTFHFCGSLLSRDAFVQKATDLASPKRLNPISPFYGEFITNLAEVYRNDEGTPDGFLFGLLQAKPHGEGTVYPDQHVLVVERDTTTSKLAIKNAALWVGIEEEGPLDLAPFVPWFAGNKPMSGKVKLQSRTAKGDLMRGWRT